MLIVPADAMRYTWKDLRSAFIDANILIYIILFSFQLMLFIAKLNGDPVAITAGGLVHITKPLIVTVCSAGPEKVAMAPYAARLYLFILLYFSIGYRCGYHLFCAFVRIEMKGVEVVCYLQYLLY